MTLVLNGSDLTVEKVVCVARNDGKVALHPDTTARIRECHTMLERKLDTSEVMYGVNTGVGQPRFSC